MSKRLDSDPDRMKKVMAKEVKEHLIQVILPFWMKLKDETYGGFYGLVDSSLNLHPKSSKGCILNSRILWFFSNAAQLLEKDRDWQAEQTRQTEQTEQTELISYARHAFLFLKNHCIDKEQGGVFWSMTYDGKAEDDTKHTYNQAFAIYALSSYYDASGEKEALDLAIGLFHCIEEKCRDQTGYLEAFDRSFRPAANDKLSENGVLAERTMNTMLHVFEAYTELYRVSKNEEVRERLVFLLHLFAEKVYNPHKHRQEVFFDKEMNSLLDLHSYGHDIEAAWLIDRGVELLGNEEYRELIDPITKDITEEIYRNAFTGNALPCEKMRDEERETFVWWVQAETVVGFFNGFEKSPDRAEYLTAARNTWNFIKEKIWDRRPGGEWFSEIGENHNPLDKPVADPWKCPYHNGRMCIEVIRRAQIQ